MCVLSIHMDDASTRFTLATLQKKRASLAGEIEDFRLKIKYREAALIHVDAVLRILAPGADPSTIPAKRPQRVKLFRQGELGLILMGVLREANQPMTVLAIVAKVIADMGLPPSSGKALDRRVRSNLVYLESRGRVVKTNERRDAHWSLAKRQNIAKSHAG